MWRFYTSDWPGVVHNDEVVGSVRTAATTNLLNPLATGADRGREAPPWRPGCAAPIHGAPHRAENTQQREQFWRNLSGFRGALGELTRENESSHVGD